jgi:hypothetical protein
MTLHIEKKIGTYLSHSIRNYASKRGNAD